MYRLYSLILLFPATLCFLVNRAHIQPSISPPLKRQATPTWTVLKERSIGMNSAGDLATALRKMGLRSALLGAKP
jgi:hypothetical protein